MSINPTGKQCTTAGRSVADKDVTELVWFKKEQIWTNLKQMSYKKNNQKLLRVGETWTNNGLSVVVIQLLFLTMHFVVLQAETKLKPGYGGWIVSVLRVFRLSGTWRVLKAHTASLRNAKKMERLIVMHVKSILRSICKLHAITQHCSY